jgi:hypothetical protein
MSWRQDVMTETIKNVLTLGSEINKIIVSYSGVDLLSCENCKGTKRKSSYWFCLHCDPPRFVSRPTFSWSHHVMKNYGTNSSRLLEMGIYKL